MATTGLHARCIGWYQRQRNATFHIRSQQVVRIKQFESDAQQCCYRRQGDIAFLPVHAQSQHIFLAVKITIADDTRVGYGPRIRTGHRAGQGKAGYLQPFGQTIKILIFLFFGAVMQQQFGRSK